MAPNLPHELLIRLRLLVWTESLFDECKENGDDDAGLETFSEADEEDCDGQLALPALW